jgi:hypothetical protein
VLEIIPVVVMPEIISVVIVSALVKKEMRRYDHRRPSPESGTQTRLWP